MGNRILRFKNEELLGNPVSMLNQISKLLSANEKEKKLSFSPSGRDGREDEILFIDARNLGHLINRRIKMLSDENIDQITDTYHNWRNSPPAEGCHQTRSDDGVVNKGDYIDIKGFCASAPKERVAELDYVPTPGRYVGLAEEEDDFNFADRFTSLKAEFEAQLKEEAELNERIAANLSKIKLDIE